MMYKRAEQNGEAFNIIAKRPVNPNYTDRLDAFKIYMAQKAAEEKESLLNHAIGGAALGGFASTIPVSHYGSRTAWFLVPAGMALGGLFGYGLARQNNNTVDNYNSILDMPDGENKDKTIEYAYNRFLIDHPNIHKL